MSYDSNLLEQQEKELVLNSFTSATAWDLGSTLRSYIQEKYPGNPVVVSVFAGSTEQLYFFATCGEGSTLDNKDWVERKRRSVVRWGKSTASLRVKFPQGPPEKYNTTEQEYAVHGGGFPLRVKGIEPLVGVVVVSGLKQEDDHAVICEVLGRIVKEQQEKEGSK